MKRLIFLTAIVVAWTAAMAVPAKPGVRTVTLPDGTTLQTSVVGDEWHHSNITADGYTIMRPFVFDFPDDPEALKQKHEYMFGPSLLISPVTEGGVSEWKTYLPKCKEGWSDYRTGTHYEGGQTVTTPVTKAYIPVFVRDSKKYRDLVF